MPAYLTLWKLKNSIVSKCSPTLALLHVQLTFFEKSYWCQLLGSEGKGEAAQIPGFQKSF